jgi:hypothetical protein
MELGDNRVDIDVSNVDSIVIRVEIKQLLLPVVGWCNVKRFFVVVKVQARATSSGCCGKHCFIASRLVLLQWFAITRESFRTVLTFDAHFNSFFA